MPSFINAIAPIFNATLIPLYERSIRGKKNKRQLQKEKWQREGKALWNARLPPVRNQDQETAGLPQETHVSSQQQSAFFGKLPLELRRLIYTYAISSEELRLEIRDDELLSGQQFRLECAAAQMILAFPKSCKVA
jgi:hypothetical protein